MANKQQKALERIFDGFTRKTMLLFVGQADKREGLRKLLEMPWRIIFTTRFRTTEQDTAASFEDLKDIIPGEKIKITEQSSDSIDSEYDVNLIKIDQEEDPFTENKCFADNCKDILKGYMKNKNNDLVIYGFDEQADGGSELYKLIWDISYNAQVVGNITFLNSDISDQNKAKLNSLGNVMICETPFENMLKRYGYSDVKGYFSEGDSALADTDFFYSNDKKVRINRNDLLGKRADTELLTENFVYKKTPMGKIALKKNFWEFMLPKRYTFPEWYGYFKKSRFYIIRETDEKLYKTVSKALKKADDTPIILYGAPCSGKTAAVGELAYRIYEERKNPVVFIRSGKEKPDARSFNDFLVKLKNMAGEEQPVLIIWDSSAINQGNRTASNSAQELRHELNEIYGRRFVLLCTAYEYKESTEDSYNTEDSESAENGNKKTRSFHIERYLGGDEKTDFLKALGNILRTYNALENREINALIKKYEEQDRADISMLFYDLSTKFESILSEGLRIERSVMSDYICEKIEKLRPKVFGSSLSSDQIKLLISYMAQNKSQESDDKKASQQNNVKSYDEQKKQLDDFNLCIALFGQVDMKAPALLARSFYPGIDPYGVAYIPWIDHRYLDDSYEDYFCFRNNLEAEMFIKSYFDGDMDRQKKYNVVFGMLKRMIRYFNDDPEARNSFFVKKSITDFLRSYGPNKDNTDKSRAYSGYKLVPDSLDELKKLIKPLRDLLNDNFDRDGAFTIIYANFCHEFFKDKIRDKDQFSDEEAAEQIKLFPEYMELLQNVISACRDAVLRVENEIKNTGSTKYNHYLKAEKNSLATEMAICDSQLKLIHQSYIDLCREKNTKPDSRFDQNQSLISMNFGDIFDILNSIIEYDQENEYCYNALLRSFEAYVKTVGRGDKADPGYVFKVGIIIDKGETIFPPSSRFYKKVLALKDHFENKLDLDGIERIESGSLTDSEEDIRLAVYSRYYNDDTTKLGVILYACRNEMKNSGNVERVFKFLNRKDILPALRDDHYANEFRLRVAWEHFTGSRFVIQDECQCISLTEKNWTVIRDICADYYECTARYYDGTEPKKDSNVVRKPSIMLVYALSRFYTGENHRDTKQFIEKNIKEEMFFNSYIRMSTPFMICEFLEDGGTPKNGITKKYSGQIVSEPSDKNTGEVSIDRTDIECRCNSRNIAREFLPKMGTNLRDIELGLGYMGFSVYTETGRENKVRAIQKKRKGR